MKKYTKPVAEVKNFAVVNKIADLNEWLTTQPDLDVTTDNIEVFSFSVAS